jgi:hypothetical protein
MFILASCQEVIERPLAEEPVDVIAVEAVLTNENVNQKVTLTHPYRQQNGQARAATGAQVTLTDGTAVYPMTELPSGSGEYYSDPFIAVAGRAYGLEIRYQGRVFTAVDQSRGVEPLQEVAYATTAQGGYELILRETGSLPHYIAHQITWRHTPFCVAAVCEGLLVQYDLKTIDAHEAFKPEQTRLVFPAGSIIVRRKYAVSDGYRAYLRAILSETAWRGGVFDVEPANAPTNLSHGAVGYFAVTSVVADTTVVQ